jgi:hypothetical protein
MTGGSAPRARALALWTLLLGLLLMHGSPAAAASGCHGAPSLAAPAAATAVPAAMPMDRTAPAGPHTTTALHAPAGPRTAPRTGLPAGSQAELRAGGQVQEGGSCAATPVRAGGAEGAPPAGAVAAVAAPAVPVVAAAADGTGRRGPPGGGRELLLRVSVARR